MSAGSRSGRYLRVDWRFSEVFPLHLAPFVRAATVVTSNCSCNVRCLCPHSIRINCLYYNEKDCSITMLITLFSQQAASANEALFGWFQMLPLLCQSSCCKRLNQRKGTQIWTMLLERTTGQKSLCHCVTVRAQA